MASTEIVYINFTGGIVSPGYLKEVLEIAASCRVSNVRFGLRQQLIIEIPAREFSNFSIACTNKNIEFASKKEALPNIVSSYPATGIFTSDSWLREGVYKDIFSSFDYTPAIKINIVDSRQSFVPFFTGHVNWICSDSIHFWYLYIRFPNTGDVYCFPELVYTNDITAISKQLEVILAARETTEGSEIYKQVKSSLSFITKPVEEELECPEFSLPYYEGFNKHENNYWLGIYRREEMFPVQLLLQVCSICIQSKIGQLYTTTWKSIIIKGIETKDRKLWDYVLGKYRINVRHAANELNWQVEDNCESGLQIKRQIIRYFDKEDVRTYGLSFAVKTRRFSSMFGSVIIRLQEIKNPARLKALERFEILYTEDFNPNSRHLVSFRKDIEKEFLGTYLVSLCKFFYERESQEKILSFENSINTTNPVFDTPPQKVIYQCTNCLTTYDETLGDKENNIASGTTFKDLPKDYRCFLCDSGKEDFTAVSESGFATAKM